MRIISYDASLQAKQMADKKVSLNFGMILGILAFFFGLTAGFGAGLVFGLVTFGLIFGIMYGLRSMITKSVYGKLSQVQVDGTYIEVMKDNEFGILVFTPLKVIYHPLQKAAIQKQFEFQITEDLFMGYGEIKNTKLTSLRNGGIPLGHVTLREMPHGLMSQFVYYNVDGAIDKVGQLLDQLSRFNPEKYQ